MTMTINYIKINKILDKYFPFVLRAGLAIVFLYFGINQLIHPQFFVGWLPKEVSLLPLSPIKFVILNGGFEVLFGSLLLLGIYRRVSALLLGLHLLGITYTIGFTEIGIRDLGLAIATLVIAMIKDDFFSLDYLFKKPETSQSIYIQQQKQSSTTPITGF